MSQPEKKPNRKLQVLSVGLPRTGSYSICLALTILGYQDAYHCMYTLDNPDHWAHFGRASDRLFPTLPTYTGGSMTAEEWDKVFAPCEAITDIAGPFCKSMIESYPDAKVIIVERAFERWLPSVQHMFSRNFGPINDFIRDWIEDPETSFVGNLQKMLLGWTGSQDKRQILDADQLRRVYDNHFATVNALVPPERLLSYRLGSGWEPLCTFLGKEIPSEPFPHGNEGAAVARTIWSKQVRTVKAAAPKMLLYLAGFAVALVAVQSVWRWKSLIAQIFPGVEWRM